MSATAVCTPGYLVVDDVLSSISVYNVSVARGTLFFFFFFKSPSDVNIVFTLQRFHGEPAL